MSDSDVSLPPSVHSEVAGSEISLPPSVDSANAGPDEVVAKPASGVCSCKLQCASKFDAEVVSKQRVESTTDSNHKDLVFEQVRALVKRTKDNGATRVSWYVGEQKVCRPFWEFYHGIGHGTVDNMLTLAKNGHVTLPSEEKARQPRAKTASHDVDAWLAGIYRGLAEPLAVEGSADRVDQLPALQLQHEIVDDQSHPLYTLALALNNPQDNGFLIPKRFVSLKDVGSLWLVFEAQHDSASKSTFLRAFKNWEKFICFKGPSQGSMCGTCASLDEQRKQATTREERAEVESERQIHLDRCNADRTVNVRGNRVAALPETWSVAAASAATMKLMIDGMDQAKFRCPRNCVQAATTQFSALHRPPLHMTGCIAFGQLEAYFIMRPDTAKDANMNITIIGRMLDRLQMLLDEDPSTQMPRHCILAADNTPRESKNQIFAMFAAFLVSKQRFETVEVQFLQAGHTKNEMDQRFSSVATILGSAPTLEDPDDFKLWMEQHVRPASGRRLVVEVLEATYDFQTWFHSLDAQMKGLTSTHLDPNANHLWCFLPRYAVEQSETIVCKHRDWAKLPSDERDVILIVKQFISSPEKSQDPILVLPLAAAATSNPIQMKVTPRNRMNEETLKQLRKTASAVAAQPWGLLKASAWLEKLCEENEENKEHSPPALQWIFQADGPDLSEVLVPSVVVEVPGEAAPREVLVQQPGRAEQRKRQLRAAEGPVMKRPCMRRPAARIRPAAAAAAAHAVNAAPVPDVAPIQDNDTMLRAVEDAGPVEAADPSVMVEAAPAVAADGLAFGCTKCRAARLGCKRCRDFASRGYRGYYFDEHGQVVHPAEDS